MDEQAPPPIGVTATVRRETAFGEGGLEIRRGTRHFAPGARVWVLPVQWGDGGENVVVVGRHRGSKGPYIRMVLPRRHLEGFRVRRVYSPALLHAMTRPATDRSPAAPRLWDDPQEADRCVAWWNTAQLEARFDDTPYTAMVDDPPPLEVAFRGTTYHLAHFNARRALYSVLPPPRETAPGAP